MSHLAELVARATIPISRLPQRIRDKPVTLSRDRLVELEALLHLRDGFRTLDNALIVRPSVTVALTRGIEDWNQLTLWRTPYRHATELLFFAEDIFGRQFALYRDEVVAFEPETGTFEHFAFRLESWAERVLDDPASLGTAQVVAWQAEHGPLAPTDRLQPSMPRSRFDGTAPELRVRNDVDLMRRYARLYKETRESSDPAALDLSWWWAD